MKYISKALFVIICLATASAAHANIITLNGTWVGDAGTAASSTLTIDTSTFGEDGASLNGGCGPCTTPVVSNWVSAFDLTVGGSAFTLTDFSDVFLDLNLGSPVDYNVNLVGQVGFVDFNFFSAGPTGTAPSTFNFNNESFALSSLMTAPSEVSAPASLSMFLLVIAAFALRKKLTSK